MDKTQVVIIKPEHHESLKQHIADAVRKTGHVADDAVMAVANAALIAVMAAGGGGAFK